MRKIYRLGNRGKVLVPFSPSGNCLCGREKQVCREFIFRYSCAGFQRLFSRKTVCDAIHRWRFGECAGGKGDKKAGSPVDYPQGGRMYFIGI